MTSLGTKSQERRGFEVEGRVQGVGFRGATQKRARQLALGGWVYNRPDGVVEVHACGEPDKLEDLKRFLRQGPPRAQVENVKEVPPDRGLPSPFEVLA